MYLQPVCLKYIYLGKIRNFTAPGKLTNLPYSQIHVQWWFVNPDTFGSGRYFRINEFSGLLNRPSVQERKSVPALFVRISEISGLSEPGLTNHHCSLLCKHLIQIIMPSGDNIGVKSILVMCPIYITSQSGALCIFLEDRMFWFVNVLSEFTKNVLRDY